MDVGPLSLALLTAKLGLYCAALIAGGLGLHAGLGVVERDQRARILRVAAAAALAALVFAAIRLAIITAQLTGSINGAFDAASFEWTWRALGPSSIAIGLGASAIVIAWLSRHSAVGVVAAVAFAASFALTGHTQALASPGLAPWASGAHVILVSFWLAAPLTLWPHATIGDDALIARLNRFSVVATIAVPILFLLAVWLAWRLAGGVAPLFTSLYGRLLLAKLAVATLALGAGAINKLWVPRAIAAAPTRGRRTLARTLALEAGVFITALALVGWATTMTGPPES